jgi:hypothetical protein
LTVAVLTVSESNPESHRNSLDFLKQHHNKPYKPLTFSEGSYISIILQRAYKADTGLFDDVRGFKRDSAEI